MSVEALAGGIAQGLPEFDVPSADPIGTARFLCRRADREGDNVRVRRVRAEWDQTNQGRRWRPIPRHEADRFGGRGEQMACNKIRGIRATLAHDTFLAEIARANNDANVMSEPGVACLTAVQVIALLVLIVGAFLHPTGGQVSSAALDPASMLTGSFVLATCMALTGFVGSESALLYADEVRDPARTVPRATVLGFVIATIGGWWAASP
ncbi:RpiB/LacA/LacB family sugar-phosphate isomerase [Cryptosporangium sp. NPDC048952]|uniref:RpiB/LacA/LacB family sugar-phosphate isomerase n=1 Tax=Cryptosporangium sp. NPDC048952 TaxID=3363961 RepID=UPI003719415B